jgi:cobyrinic acid a,c-diamide synthase
LSSAPDIPGGAGTEPQASGFVLAGMHGSSGKTVLSCLLLAGLEARGLSVQPFKAGPDYIDPGYHNRYASRPSRNLDAWLMGRERVLEEARAHTRSATGVLEGVMGLFDGAHPTSEEGSTMELARWLGWPVVLSVPAAKAGRSLAAGLRGFLAEASPDRIAGVVLSGVSGDSHTEYLREALQPTGIPVLGAIPKMEALEWPERHLGLQAAQERPLPSKRDLAEIARRTLDLDAFATLARRPALPKVHGDAPRQVLREPVYAGWVSRRTRRFIFTTKQTSSGCVKAVRNWFPFPRCVTSRFPPASTRWFWAEAFPRCTRRPFRRILPCLERSAKQSAVGSPATPSAAG